MRKSTMILSALLLGGAAFSANAQGLYLSGSFNDNNPNGATEWEFTQGEDPDYVSFSGTFEIPEADVVTFYLNQAKGNLNYSPSSGMDDNGYYVASEENVDVDWDDDIYQGYFAQVAPMTPPSSWVINNWQGGKLEINVDMMTNDITFLIPSEEGEGEPVAVDLVLSGNFNEYAVAGEEWGISYLDTDTYRGTFEIPAQEGGLIFNVARNGGRNYIVPGVVEGGDLEPATENVTVEWDGEFVSLPMATEDAIEQGNAKWVIADWNGGSLEVTVDFANNEVLLSAVQDETPVESTTLYIVGDFNEYNANGLETWALTATEEEGVYRGTFDLPDNAMFYIQDVRRMVYVPGFVDDNEEISPAETDQEVDLLDGFYQGVLAQTPIAGAKWYLANWAGGDVEVTVDLINNHINVSVAQEEPVVMTDLYIAGNFNDYNPSDLEIWNLQVTDDTEVYRGTFPIPANETVTFYISRMGGNMVLVPGQEVVEEDVTDVEPAETNVTVVWDEDYYEGYMAQTSVNDSMWVIENWAGGDLEVTVDFRENKIMLSSIFEEAQPESHNFYLAGNFNENNPDNLEIWALTATDAEGVYRGTFDLPANAEFYVERAGRLVLVPGVEVAEEDVTDVTPAEENVNVTLEDGVYNGVLAQTTIANVYWVIEEEGTYEITVDLVNNSIVVSVAAGEEPSVLTDLYIAGNFNDYQPEDLEIWNLGVVEGDPEVYRGTFNIAAGDVEFYISRMGGNLKLVPGVEVAEEDVTDVEPSEDNVIVVLEDGSYQGLMAQTSMGAANWVIQNWEGGDLEVTVDFANNMIVLSTVAEEPSVLTDLYIAGNFNEYQPEGLEIWNLGVVEGDPEVYRGTFNIAAGEVEFYISRMGGYLKLVPGVEVVEEEGTEVEPAEDNVLVALEDGFYSGPMAQTSLGAANWVITNWEGGDLEVTVDFANNLIVLSAVAEEPSVMSDLFIAGNFNEYTPNDLEIWNLGAVEGDSETYRGTFELQAGEIEFYISRMGGNMKLVPGVVTDGEVEPSEDNVTVELEDGFYSGAMAQTSLGGGNWVITNWEGGLLEVTVDFANNEIILSAVAEEPSVMSDLFIAGNFNEYTPNDLEIWNLGAVEGEVDTYRGTFELQAGELEFYISRMGGNMKLVPGVVTDGEVEPSEDNVTVELENGFYSGAMAQTSLGGGNWVITNWEGGSLEVTVDFANNEIILSAIVDEPVVLTDLYIAGSFNDYTPSDLEIWNFGYAGEPNVYEGTFEVPEAAVVDFYISRMGGNLEIVPGVELEGDVEPSEADEVVEFVNNVYEGLAAQTSLGASKWVIYDWAGGYLKVTVNVETGAIVIEDATETSGVDSIKDALNNGAIYNLQGVRVDANKLTKGIYIINGKKVLVK